jgi:hypothetical protein
MSHWTIGKRTFEFEFEPAQIARDHPRLARARNQMINESGDVELVDTFLTRRFAAAVGKFGHDYWGEMSTHIDRIFTIRDELAGTVEASLRGETVHIDALQKNFESLSQELKALRSPDQAVKSATTIEAPREPPLQTRAPEPPPSPRGRRGGTPPADPLAQAAAGRLARRGLEIVEAQPAAPELRKQLAAVAQQHGARVAGDLLRRIANYLTPAHAEELKGLSRFLEVADQPRALRRLLGARDDEIGGTVEVLDWIVPATMRMLGGFSPEAAQGLAVLFSRGNPARTALSIFLNFRNEPQIAVGIFESLARLESHDGLNRVISSLAHSDPQTQKGAIGQLLTANQLLDRLPADARLVFEETRVGPYGERRADIVVLWKQGISVHIEVKFFTTFESLGRRSRDQLALDLVQDVENRRLVRDASGLSVPPLSGIRWRFERGNLTRELQRRLGREPSNIEIRAEIRARLRDVFTENEAMLRAELGAEFDTYRAAFEDLAFVDLY